MSAAWTFTPSGIALRLGVVGPDGVPAVLAEQAIVDLLVDQRPRHGVERVVEVVDAAAGGVGVERVDGVQRVVVVELAVIRPSVRV